MTYVVQRIPAFMQGAGRAGCVNQNVSWCLGASGIKSCQLFGGSRSTRVAMCQPLSWGNWGRRGIVSARGRAGGLPLWVRKGSRRTFEKASQNTEACGSS